MGYFGEYSRGKYTGHTSNDEQAFLYIPDDYQRDRTKRGVVFVHGANGSYKAGGSGGSTSAFGLLFQQILTNYRLPILTIDAGGSGSQVISSGTAANATNITGGPTTWGGPVAMRAMDNAYTWATTASTYASGLTSLDIIPAFLNTGGVILIGYSEGGAVVLNWAARNPTLVKAIVLISGAVNIDSIYTSGRGSYTSSIDAGYQANVSNAPTVTPAVGATTAYDYKLVTGSDTGDSVPSTAGSTTTGALLATVNNTLAWTWPAGAANLNTAPIPRTIKILRNRAGGGYLLNDTIGTGVLSANSGTAAGTVTLTVEALTAAIPSGTTLLLVSTDWTSTQTVTTSALANAAATSISVTSFTPSFNFPVGSRVLPTKYVDTKTTDGSAYTQLTSAWTTNGKNASPSFNPTANVPSGLQAIPLQMWWSANDGIIDAVGSVGTPTTNVQAYKNAYGANCTLQELSGDPVHASSFGGFGSAEITTFLNFISANM